MDYRNLSNAMMTSSHVLLKNAWEGGKKSTIVDEACGIETLICESRFEATRTE